MSPTSVAVSSFGFRPPRARVPRILLTSLFVAIAGCRAAPEDPAAGERVAAAVGVAAPVEFRAEPRPLDEPALPPGVLTLAAATERAVRASASLQAALARVRIAFAEAEQARQWPNPILGVQFGWFAGSPWINAGLDQDLVGALLSGRRADAADHRLRAATAAVVRSALDLVLELQSGYVAVQASDALVPLLQQRLELAERVLELTRVRLQAGDVAEADVTTLEAVRIEVQLELDLALRERRQRRLQLARLLGEPDADGDWPLEPFGTVPSTTASEGEQVRMALGRRPELLELRWQLAALGDDAAVAPWTVWEGGSVGPLVQQQQGQTAYGPAFALPLPLFDTGAARGRRAEAACAEARHQLLDAERKVVQEVRVAMATLASTRAYERRLVDELLPRLRARRSNAEAAYTGGQTDITPLLLAEDDLRNAEVKQVLYRQQTTTALLELRRALGGPEHPVTGS